MGGGGPAPKVTVIVEDTGLQSPRVGFWPSTIKVSEPLAGLNEPVKPAVVAVLAFATDSPKRFGTTRSGAVPVGAAVEVTETVEVFGMQSPGFDDGLVTWAITVSASFPAAVAGAKLPVNPAAVHLARAVDTVIPTMLGTVAEMQVGEPGAPSRRELPR